MAQPTLADLINDSYYETGIYSPGETVDPDHVTFGFNRLNSMIDGWKTEKMTIFREQRLGPFNLVSGTQAYTIGPSGDWVAPRPIWIDWAGLVQQVQGGTPPPEYRVQVMTNFEWATTVQKALQSTIPTALWYDRTYTSNGSGTIYIWPVPTVANQITLYCPVPVDEFAIGDLNTDINFPPGYRDFLMYHLALRVAPTFGKTLMEASIAFASEAREKVKNSNMMLNTLRVDDALIRRDGGYYNWMSDSWDYR